MKSSTNINNMAISAVQYLESILLFAPNYDLEKILKEAKRIEKDQIIEAYAEGNIDLGYIGDIDKAEDYYEFTYNNEPA